MSKKEFIDYVADKSKIKQTDLIEKDFILHSILVELEKDKYFNKNFVFKGGTCITKCYLGYYRFSEDIDFSWINQNLFKDRSEKQIRKILSLEIDKLIKLLNEITGKLGLFFKADKQDPKFIEFGGSNKFVTFKIWYKSDILNKEQLIKIQVNFVETFNYKFETLKAKSIIENIDKKEIRFLFPSESEILLTQPQLKVYDLKEILIEKIRAILTRRGVKARDFIDAFIILNELNEKIQNFEKNIIFKIRFMLKYEKYLENLRGKKYLENEFKLGEETKLLLKPIDEGFYKFLDSFYLFLNELLENVNKEINLEK